MKIGKKAKAHHEAGHAVIARVLGVKVSYAAMLNSTVEAYSVMHLAKDSSSVEQIAGAEKDILVMLAGPLAQLRYQPMTKGQMRKAASGGWLDDMARAKAWAAKVLYFQKGGASAIWPKPTVLSAGPNSRAR